MSNAETFTRVAEAYAGAFDAFVIDRLPANLQPELIEWVYSNPQYIGTFSTKMRGAIEWVDDNPNEFDAMVENLEAGILLLNSFTSTTPVPQLYLNTEEYIRVRDDKALLPLGHTNEGDRWNLTRTIFDAARRLRLGETIKPKNGEWYAYHMYVQTDRGMVAASLLDLYENYARTSGAYPQNASKDAIIANSLTEAIHAMRPDGPLFDALKQKADGWIYGYDGFSQMFQDLVYADQ